MKLKLYDQSDRQAAELFARLMDLWHYVKIDIDSESPEPDVKVCRDNSLGAESFRLVCKDGKAAVYGSDSAGVVYGLSALITKGFDDIDITESPRFKMRGVHVYMPPKENIEDFKRIIDMLAYLKLNQIILEVGGGMEYKRHPEINEGWERFCKAMEAFPGGPVNMQGTDGMPKDSTHTELGGGSYVPQESVRELVNYAKAYGISVIPELQMLSHSYYITNVYPELAERQPDYNPDTVCPRNENAYKLYFELAEEVIDVFQPKIVSIGHDEIMTLGLCDECKKYTGHELLAYEINRLHEFYNKHGIRITMWGEKLMTMKSYYFDGIYGGDEEHGTNRFDRKWVLPASYEALQKIPKDVLLLDWLYLHSIDSFREAERNGFQQWYGNFCGEITRHWERRLESDCILGAEMSSWVLADEATLGRDNIIGEFLYSSKMLWSKDYDESKNDEYQIDMQRELPKLRESLQNKRSALISVKNANAEIVYKGINEKKEYSLPSIALPNRGIFGELKNSLPAEINGIPVGETDLSFPVGKNIKSLAFVHTCMATREWRYSYYMPIQEYYPMIYAIRYEDGVTLHSHVMFGTNIGYIGMDFGRRLNYTGKTPTSGMGFGEPEYPEKFPDPPLYILNYSWKNSLLYSASPFIYDNKCYYIMEWENPRPDVKVERVFAVNNAKKRDEQAILFCAAAVL